MNECGLLRNRIFDVLHNHVWNVERRVLPPPLNPRLLLRTLALIFSTVCLFVDVVSVVLYMVGLFCLFYGLWLVLLIVLSDILVGFYHFVCLFGQFVVSVIMTIILPLFVSCHLSVVI